MINGKPQIVIHDYGKQFTSKAFKHFLVQTNIRDKRIPKLLPSDAGKDRSIQQDSKI